MSLSARRAWIEIFTADTGTYRLCVALRKESVDRNPKAGIGQALDYVTVALRKESVDRNQQSRTTAFSMYGSLSARRAWIEIAI